MEAPDDPLQVALRRRVGPERPALLPGELAERLLADLDLLLLREEHQLGLARDRIGRAARGEAADGDEPEPP
jgi:hypothetical protein